MANVRLGNIWSVDTTGTLTTEKNQRVAGIVFTSSGAGDNIVLRETSSGANKMSLKLGTANDSHHFDFSIKPLVFANGIHIQTLSASATAIIILTNSGGD